MVDSYTKAVLTVIAFALVLLVLQPFYMPQPEQATVEDIASDVHGIAIGRCRNSNIC